MIITGEQFIVEITIHCTVSINSILQGRAYPCSVYSIIDRDGSNGEMGELPSL